MSWIDIVRLVTFVFTLVCSLLALAMGGSVISVTSNKKFFFRPQTLSSSAMAVAIGVLTMVTVGAMTVVDLLRSGAFTSMILVELIWLNLLWVLWLVVGALAAQDFNGFWSGTCDWTTQEASSACQETQAVAAFGFLACFALGAYTTLLLVLAIMRHSRGVPIWKSSVKQSFHSGMSQYSDNKLKAMDTSDSQHQYPPAVSVAPSPPQGYPQV
ncbi:hypothetical protein OBBRIDRAFT_830559 [Obba rivulosa]|uniref:MARVEL domain-containing protein n=1 Tax=Obba rivulosa TaxID=1052685 RepID=A0A8E2DU96_9APHY|nr:hypothetical protein OBBRIDRAFT_830559 [Obba rivulosa]